MDIESTMSRAYNSGIEVRTIESHEVATLASLTNEEGWNNDVSYLQASYSLVGMQWNGAALNGQIIGSSVSYEYEDGMTAFCGLYLVDKRYRNASIGSSIAEKTSSRLKDINVLCFSLQPSRLKYPFYPSHIACMWTYRKPKGCILSNVKALPQTTSSGKIRILPLKDISLEKVAQYDASLSAIKTALTAFFNCIIIGHGSKVFVAVNSCNEVVGYAVLRKAHEGWRFAPIYGDSPEIGRELFTSLVDSVADGELITVNTFDDNSFMNALLKDVGFEPGLSNTLMYTQHPIDVPVGKVFAIASLEFVPF